jgi:signal transduction histidine kinase
MMADGASTALAAGADAQFREGIAGETDVDRLQERIARLEDEKRELAAFAAMAAHELLEPLVMAEGYAQLVRDRLDAQDHASSIEDLDALCRGMERTRILIETLLRERSSADRPLERRHVDMQQIVDECVEMLVPEIAARQASVVGEDLPAVRGDGPLLGGLVKNLLVNGLKYGPRAGGSMRVSAAREPGAWRISVASEGPSIAEPERRTIFQPFHRASGERRIRGAGLGLAVCRRIVERHGGTIGLEAAPASGSGNVFFFVLPD